MTRYCRIFHCDQRGDRYCCADCYLWRDCGRPCLNHPTRCGQVEDNHKPRQKRGPRGPYKKT